MSSATSRDHPSVELKLIIRTGLLYWPFRRSVIEAIVAILHRPDLELGDEVTSTSQLTAREISSYRLRPDEIRTYGRRIYNAAAGRWIFERGMVD